MRRFLFLLLSITVLTIPATSRAVSTSQNLAIAVTSSTPPPSCPQGTAYPDGCSAAPAGTAQLPNLFSAPFPPHTAAYAVRPPWNVPGVDYYVGCTLSVCAGTPSGPTGTDPTVSGNLPAGASYNPGTHLVTISANNVTLSGFDFCNPSGSPNGVNIWISGGVTGTIITNSKFCANQYMSYSQGQTVWVCEDVYCSGGSNTSDLTMTYSEIDGLVPKAGTGGGLGYWIEIVAAVHLDRKANTRIRLLSQRCRQVLFYISSL